MRAAIRRPRTMNVLGVNGCRWYFIGKFTDARAEDWIEVVW